MMKYNHVIFWNDWDLYKQSFSDLQDKSYARYITSPGFCYKPANSLIGGVNCIFTESYIDIRASLKKLETY